MADTALEQILDDLRKSVATYYPKQEELKNLRVVGHTPKSDHMIYDVCADFPQGSERMAIKIYRPGRCANPKAVARQEITNLQFDPEAMRRQCRHLDPARDPSLAKLGTEFIRLFRMSSREARKLKEATPVSIASAAKLA